jgi:hypothetical protein
MPALNQVPAVRVACGERGIQQRIGGPSAGME